MPATYELTVDLHVLRHLGIGLYSNMPAVISEMVANAYDADATKVEITVSNVEIVIQDNGFGMSVEDANKKFLTVGYDKRHEGDTETIKYHRHPMGRKGIGKLSTFAIANEVEVMSVKTDVKSGVELGRAGFTMLVSKIEEQAKQKKPYHPIPLDLSTITLSQGTRIVLRDLKKRSVNPDYIRTNLARRFSVLGAKFQVLINGKEVTINDRKYWDKLQFVWGLGDDPAYKTAKKGKKVKKSHKLTDVIAVPGKPNESVSGWIGTVHFPRELKDSDIDNNGIVVLARGKLVHENLLPFARTGRIFAEYVVGEINADWLDEDASEDMATSGRQSLREDDVRFVALRTYLKERLDEIANKWTEWRKEVGLHEAIERHPILEAWLDEMTPDNRKHAEKLISTIDGMPVSDPDSKKELLRYGVMAFETLALKGNVAALNDASSIDPESLREILRAMEDLELAHYYQVAKNRWTVLKEFEKLVDSDEKEKFLQEHIYKNTWLLDASWERPTEDVRKERRFTEALKAKKLGLDRNLELSRYDIKFLSISGKDLIVELKRSGRTLKVSELIEQVRKYGDIMETLAKDTGSSAPDFEIIILVGKLPAGYDRKDEQALSNYKARVMTYEYLIEHARATYGSYLEKQKDIERIQAIVDSL